MSATDLGDAVGEEPREVGGGGFVRHFLEHNYFYILSALLMIWGCYLLMQSVPADGGELWHVAKTFSLLQAYELLILATCFAIVHRLARLDDAFTLLAIELVLLLDPTFFTNSFHTLLQSDRATSGGVAVNAAVFLLVPVKLLLLQWFLHLRLTPRGFFAFVAAAALVYLAPRGLAVTDAAEGLDRHLYFYALLWTLPLYGMLLPQAEAILSRIDNREGFLNDSQRRHLPWIFIAIPLPLAVLHLAQAWYVHQLVLFGSYFAPLLMMAAARIVQKPVGPERFTEQLAKIDVLAAIALFLALPHVRTDWLEVYNKPSPFFFGMWPVAVSGLGVATAYAAFWFRHHAKAALWRLAVLALVGLAGAAYAAGYVHSTGAMAQDFAKAILHFVSANLGVLLWLSWCVVLGAFLLTRMLWIAGVAAYYGFALLTVYIPGGAGQWWAEFVQLFFLIALVLYHAAATDRPVDRRTSALLVLAFALARFGYEPAAWSAAVVLLESAALMAIGLRTRDRWYITFGAIAAAGVAAFAGRSMIHRISPAVAMVALALLLFAAGVWTTFHKGGKKVVE